MMKNSTRGAGDGHFSAAGYFHCSDSQWNSPSLPHLTALASTLAQIELLLDRPVVDLAALAEVVESDIILTSQLLRLVNIDRHPDDSILRIEDCLVELGITWLLAMVRELPVSTQDFY
jgi:c-di-GMP-related signal transduction protein